LPNSKGHYPNDWNYKSVIRSWIQCTNLSIDAFQSIKQIYAWATDMLNGGIIEDVKFVISGKQESIQIEGMPSPISFT